MTTELQDCRIGTDRPPRITRGTEFCLIHVGKCGGGTVRMELRRQGFPFRNFHLVAPEPVPGEGYVVLVRDPVRRLVSAFNWRRQIYSKGLRLTPPGSRQAMESEFLNRFEGIHDLAEQLGTLRGPALEVLRARTLEIGHVRKGFVWHLQGLLASASDIRILAVMAQETLAADMQAVFGVELQQAVNVGDPEASTELTPTGQASLVGLMVDEYRCLARLADRVRSDGGYLPSLLAHPGDLLGKLPS